MSLEERLRGLVASRCGGKEFDKPTGAYSFSAVLAKERDLEKGNSLRNAENALLKLSITDPTWKMPRGAMQAMPCYYDQSSESTRYTDNAGIRKGNSDEFGDTHQEICDYLKIQNPGLPAEFNADWVQYSPGAVKRSLAEYIPTLFFSPNDWLILPRPGYPVIAAPENNRGINVFNLDLKEKDEWKILPTWEIPDSIKMPPISGYLIRTPANRFLYFNIPHNPTGITYSKEELKAIIEWAKGNNVFLIVDEAYDLLRYDDSRSILNIDGWEEVAVVLQSVSKGWNATGLRFGWVIGHPILIKAVRKVMDYKDSGLFGPSIAAGLTCLRHPEWAQGTNRRYRELHQKLAEGLKDAGFQSEMPKAGLCQFTKAPRKANGQEFKSLIDCVQWFRNILRISLMHYDVCNEWYLRWAVTIKPVPECNLPTELSVIEETVRRLQEVKFEF